MRTHCPTCTPWVLSDPAQVLRDIERSGLLRFDNTLLVVTDLKTGGLVAARPLTHDLGADSFDDELEAAITSCLPVGAGRREHVVSLVLCRDRRTVPHPGDMDPWISWLNATSVTGTCCGEWFLVTGHGWRSLISSTGPCGLEPVARG